MPADQLEQSDIDPNCLRLETTMRLRWIAVIGQLLAVGFVHFILGFKLPIGFCLTAIAFSAWFNIFLRLRFAAHHRLNTQMAGFMLAYDILQLGALLYLTGGVENPFTFLIVVPTTVSAACLPRQLTVALGVLTAIVSALLVQYHLPLPWTAGETLTLPTLYKIGVVACILTGMVFLALYAGRMSNETRQMSAALAATELVLSREQRLHALDGLAAAAAHELGTPLGTIVIVTKELERELPKDSPLMEDIKLLRSQALRCRDILQTLTKKPKQTDPMMASVSVEQLLREAADPYKSFDKKFIFTTQPDASAVASGVIEPGGERRPGVIYGLGNIIENATDFATTTVEISGRWSGQMVMVTVADDGPGFKRDVIDSLGEPYITTRPSNNADANGDVTGLGLGFFIAKSLLERSGAVLSFENREAPATGAVVRIVWSRDVFMGAVDPEFHRKPPSALPSRSTSDFAPGKQLETVQSDGND